MKTILITGATDGLGRATAEALVEQGHRVMLHGRSTEKLEKVAEELSRGTVETVRADLSDMGSVAALADEVAGRFVRIDVLINNAGVFKTPQTRTAAGLDTRFAVNTLAPYLLTRRLLPLLGTGARVVNLSSAAQSPVSLAALRGETPLQDMEAYAQSKLALTAWTRTLAAELGPGGPVIVAVNPGSLLATRMVREGFGTQGNDIGIGSDILTRAALSDTFADASGRYFDNDAGAFAAPHPDADDDATAQEIARVLDDLIDTHLKRKTS